MKAFTVENAEVALFLCIPSCDSQDKNISPTGTTSVLVKKGTVSNETAAGNLLLVKACYSRAFNFTNRFLAALQTHANPNLQGSSLARDTFSYRESKKFKAPLTRASP